MSKKPGDVWDEGDVEALNFFVVWFILSLPAIAVLVTMMVMR